MNMNMIGYPTNSLVVNGSGFSLQRFQLVRVRFPASATAAKYIFLQGVFAVSNLTEMLSNYLMLYS